MVTTTKHWRSASSYDLTSGSDIGFVCLGYVFFFSFLIFPFTIVQTDSQQVISLDISNLLLQVSVQCRLLMFDQSQSRHS